MDECPHTKKNGIPCDSTAYSAGLHKLKPSPDEKDMVAIKGRNKRKQVCLECKEKVCVYEEVPDNIC